MNDDRINELIGNIKNDTLPSKEAVDDFINSNLTASQANAVQNILKNPQLIRDILQSPQARKILDRLGGKGD